MASYVESKYDKIKLEQEYQPRPELPTFTPMERNFDFDEEHVENLDMLDVKMMEKSLDKKYKGSKPETGDRQE